MLYYIWVAVRFYHYIQLFLLSPVCLGGHEPEWRTQSPSAWKGIEHQTRNGGPVHLRHCQICKCESEPNSSVFIACVCTVILLWISWSCDMITNLLNELTWSPALCLSFVLAHSLLLLSLSQIFMLESHIFDCNFDSFLSLFSPSAVVGFKL